MQMNDSRRIAAPRATVWAALNDPAILRAAIPGCESLEMTSPTEMTAKVTLKVGPVKATFGGNVTLSDIDAPNGYRIIGEGSGGVAGFAKGGATVRLEDDGPDATLLTYTVDAQIGGKLAQLGSRLIDGTARRLAEEFFDRLGQAVAPASADEAAMPVEVPDAPDGAPAKTGWFSRVLGKSGAAIPVILVLAGVHAHACCLSVGDAGEAGHADGMVVCRSSSLS